ncbi:LOW QUALITY PROTEIN: cadherin-related family member 5 [Menidia menidia]
MEPAAVLLGCVAAVCLPPGLWAQRLCTVPPGPVTIPENNTVDVQVVKIICGSDVSLSVTENPEQLFYITGTVLMVRKGLDYEALGGATLVAWVQCSRAGSRSVNESVEVLVGNVNDNPPNFPQTHFLLEVDELTPVNASVGLIQATDVDSEPLYYRLESATVLPSGERELPRILVRSLLDYDAVQRVSLVLHVQDTLAGSSSDEPFFTSVASITVQVRDVDNRPPWFQPCQRSSLGLAKLCLGSGYRGRVNLTEKEEGPLVLEPGPVYAKDGDRNRSEQISYRILRGNEGNIFQIDEETGNITMTKAADIVGPIILTVLASQVTNRDQFAVTQVAIEVMKKSRNAPRFEKERYEGFIYSNSVPESMILRDRSTNRPFRVRARDEDFAGGVNPDLKYEVQYSSYVNVTADGFVVLKRVVKTESFALQLRAVDGATGEFGTAALSVQVIPAVAAPSPSSVGYRAGDMALLGLVMAALLVLCLIVIGFLVSRLWTGNAGVDKICECLGPCLQTEAARSGHRDSLQFTNDGFQTEGDPGRGGGGGGGRGPLPARRRPPPEHLPPAPGPPAAPGGPHPALLRLRPGLQPPAPGPEGPGGAPPPRRAQRRALHPGAAAAARGPEDGVVQGEPGLLRRGGGDHPRLGGPGGGGDRGGGGDGDGDGGGGPGPGRPPQGAPTRAGGPGLRAPRGPGPRRPQPREGGGEGGPGGGALTAHRSEVRGQTEPRSAPLWTPPPTGEQQRTPNLFIRHCEYLRGRCVVQSGVSGLFVFLMAPIICLSQSLTDSDQLQRFVLIMQHTQKKL